MCLILSNSNLGTVFYIPYPNPTSSSLLWELGLVSQFWFRIIYVISKTEKTWEKANNN